MPPLESFMGISPNYCREHFFNSLEKRDLVVGVVSSVMDSGVVVTLLCMDGGKVRDIDELKTTAFCPVKELPRLFANQSPLEGFQVKDKVRGVVLNVNQETERIIISMVERALSEEQSNIKLGLINEDDFPVHYRRKLHIRGLAFDELLHSILGFNNSGNVSSLLGLLHLSDSTSIMRGLHRKTIPEKEYAESLRKYQSQKWAHQSVANGVSMFKAGKQVEAMQYLNKALQIDSKNVEALVARGALYANNESYNLAIEDFELALKFNNQHQNARKYLYETLLAFAKVLEDQTDFENAEKQYRKAILLQPSSVEVRELIRYMIVRKERKERERALRGRSPSPVIPQDRSLDKSSDRHKNRETSKTLKKLIQEDRSRLGDSHKRRRSAGDDLRHRSYSPEQEFRGRSHPRRHRSTEFDSSSSSSGSSSSGSSSDSSSSSDSEDSSIPRDRRHQRRVKDSHSKEEMEKDTDKYINPESSREIYQAELDRRSAAAAKVPSPSEAYAVDHTSSFLFGADGNYRTSPPEEERKKSEVKEQDRDKMCRKDEGAKEKHNRESSKHKSKSHSIDKNKQQSRKRSVEQEGDRSRKDPRSSHSSDRSTSRSHQKKRSRESFEDVSDRDIRLDSSFETKRDQFSESGSGRVSRKSERKENKIHEFHKSPEFERDIFIDKEDIDRKDRRKSGSKEKTKKYKDEDEYSTDSKSKVAGKTSERKLPPRKRDRSRSSSAHSFEDKRERSLSPEEHKRQYLQMKYESWKQATNVELERKRKQAEYNKRKPQDGDSRKASENRITMDKNKLQSRSQIDGHRSSSGQGSLGVVQSEEIIKSKWDSPGEKDARVGGDGQRRRRSRFDMQLQDQSRESEERVFSKTIILEGKRKDDKHASKKDERELSTVGLDAVEDKVKLKKMTDKERAQVGRDMEGLRIHIKNDHFSESNKVSEENIKRHSDRDSLEGSIASSRGTHTSTRHRRPSPELEKDKSKHRQTPPDIRADSRHKSDYSSSESESSNGSYHDDVDEELPDRSSGRYKKIEKMFNKKDMGKYREGASGSRNRHYSEGSDYSKQKHNLPDVIQSARRENKQANKYVPRGLGRGRAGRGRGGYKGRNWHRGGRGRNQYKERGEYKESFKDKRNYGRDKHFKGSKRSRSPSSSDSWSSRSSSYSSSSSQSPSRSKTSRYSASSRKGSYSNQSQSWSSNRSPHSYVDPYAKGKPKFTSAKFPKVKQPLLGELAMSEPKVQPQPAPLTVQEEQKKKEVLFQLENFLSQLKEKKKEQVSVDEGTAKTPEKV
ncbi:tetratricopeptide repeat protein 14-like isoform X2 [Mizuhopecten yessoensis]|nr:tetratricopeptide repeat protein 14-like isoform X2 [Mizuhopecten yessoensis]XP_021370647.1 tetratricopeptide repeat protein 14-like isoform X2 [Mizuhopecten yessoensis]XP_021370649.1 tetratricopeptide repeat protein 14-like isoform X2 [Mizuhopecten yessoensis]